MDDQSQFDKTGEATCPYHAFDPLDLSDPFPMLARARREQPVFYSPAIDYWVVTRYEDVKAIFRDHETYTAANTITPIVPFSDAVRQMLAAGDYTPEPVLSNNVPPSHTRIRALVNRLFTPRRMKSFAPAIRDIAERGVGRLLERGRAPLDIVAALTYEYPAYVLFHVLGVPDADVPQVKAWAGNRIKLYYGRPTTAEQIAMTENLVPFWRYVVELVAEKARAPGDDLTSDLIRMRAGDDSVLTLERNRQLHDHAASGRARDDHGANQQRAAALVEPSASIGKRSAPSRATSRARWRR